MRFESTVVALSLSLVLTGCAFGPAATPSADGRAAVHGILMGGQQPIHGARLYVLAANTTGYGQPSASLILDSVGALDTSGGISDGDRYITTDDQGNFNIDNDYACSSGDQQVYLYATGGDSGGGPNPAIGGMAVLGPCNNLPPFITMNEVTTVAAAYALAGFATDAAHISSSGTALAKIGVANAFANAANLADVGSGAARATTPNGKGTVPQRTINTLANILAACVNSTGSDPTPCPKLFANALSSGTSGAVPVETATTAINIAHNPVANIANLYPLASSSPPFQTALTTRPSNFTLSLAFADPSFHDPLGIAVDGKGAVWISNAQTNSVSVLSPDYPAGTPAAVYTGSGLASPAFISIDASGNAWISNQTTLPNTPDTVTEFSNAGIPLSGSGGFLTQSTGLLEGIAVDVAGNVWFSNGTNNFVGELSSSGALLSGAGYGIGTGSVPYNLAFDGTGNVWFPNDGTDTVSKLSSTGTVLWTSGTSTLSRPTSIALDSAGNAWVANTDSHLIAKFSNTGTLLSGTGYVASGVTEGYKVAIDGAGNAWISDLASSVVAEFSNSGVLLSGSSAFTVGQTGGGLSKIAIDGSGNIWATNGFGNSIGELVGAATPVITPIVAGLPTTPTTDGSSNLGTRP